ncbi:hypothetical protein DL764_006922 [Monosporascus ibericus]|uniref:HNH domain-containing protein n=1 Tax=Monosporascus ibericus TaxID=155417 RepID=A0A4Q4T5E9_9PEZI|nr:hypothetical protein DL764_006922 [Monosporascus ibericus]
MAVIPPEQQRNFEIFRDCLSTVLIEKISQPQSQPKRRTKPNTNKKAARASQPHFDNDTSFNPAEDLADFTDYIASETFQYLPEELRILDYYGYSKDTDLQARYALPLTGDNVADLLPALDPSISDSLTAYGITHDAVQAINEFLAPVLTSLVNAISTPPPVPSSTKAQAEGCEICGRDWIPLSYHHLIPRFVHAKAVKRGWHREEVLQNVAWLCGACHRFVHRFADHEELARHYYTVELLMQEEQVVKWADWVGRLRWKGR